MVTPLKNLGFALNDVILFFYFRMPFHQSRQSNLKLSQSLDRSDGRSEIFFSWGAITREKENFGRFIHKKKCIQFSKT